MAQPKLFIFATAVAVAGSLGPSPALAQVAGDSAGQLTKVGMTPAGATSPTRMSRIGLMVGAGVPDGASLSLAYRPVSWLRSEVGGSYNMISKGVRGGISLIPFGSGPSATVEAGHYFDGDANGIATSIAGAGFKQSAALQRIGYDFVNAHLGLEFGSRRLVFFVHAGMSYVRASVHDLNTQLETATPSAGTTVSFNRDPVVRVVTPSAKLGLIFYIW